MSLKQQQPQGATPVPIQGGTDGEIPQQQMTPEQAEQMKQRKEAEEQKRSQILCQIFEPSARERLARINLVKPQIARQVEDMLISVAMKRGLPGKINEEQVIKILNDISSKVKESAPKVIIHRKRLEEEEEDDDFSDL